MDITVRKHFNDPELWVAQWAHPLRGLSEFYDATGHSEEEARANLLDVLRVAGVRLSAS